MAVRINSQLIPQADTAKYFGMKVDAKLRWSELVKKNQEELEIKYKKIVSSLSNDPNFLSELNQAIYQCIINSH